MVRKSMSREEIMSSIKKRSFLDELDVFMLGLDAPLEREIMRYVYSNQNKVNLQMLQLHFVYKLNVCTPRTLSRRLESLCKFNFLARSDFGGTIFYEVVKDNGEEVVKDEGVVLGVRDEDE